MEENQEAPVTTENKTTEPEDNKPAETAEQQEDKDVDSSKVVDKLKKRIGKEQSEKNDYAKQLVEAQKQLEEFKKAKSVSKLSEEDKAKQAATEKDNQIKALENKLKLAESTQQTDSVFKEAGLKVNSNVLGMVVSTDDDKTYSNAKALIDFANTIRNETKQEFLNQYN